MWFVHDAKFDAQQLLLDEDVSGRMSSITFLRCALKGDVICLNISIIDDSRVEYDETFSITLTVDNPLDTINRGSTAVTDATIVDNDGMMLLCIVWVNMQAHYSIYRCWSDVSNQFYAY